MANDQIFITGTSGLAGRYAIDELNQRNFALRILVRNLPQQNLSDQNIYVEGDLAQLKSLEEFCSDNAGIIHYACASLRGRADPEIDIEAMKVLLKNWGRGPFVFISSIDVYGSPQVTDMIEETHALSARMNAYARGKIACEKLLIKAAKTRGRNDFTILRAPWIFAPNLSSKNHIQSRFLDGFKNEIILPGKTKTEWEKNIDSWIDARDLAWIVGEAVKKPLSGAGNTIGGQYNWHEFFSVLKSCAKLTIPITHKPSDEVEHYAAELFGQSCSFSGEKINRYYNFKPRYSLEETLRGAFHAS